MDYQSYLKGGFAGTVGLLLSHPFDTIKSNIQAKTTIEYNLRFLYRGIMSPLIGIYIEKAIVFGTYTNMHKFLDNKYNSTLNTAISGGTAGILASFVVTPYERIKILFQTQKKNELIVSKLIHPKNLFKGLSATFTREVPGFSIYFTTYTQIEKRFYNGHYTIFGSFIAGGLSGSFAWLFIYPQDMIKTKIQSQLHSRSHAQSVANIIKNIKNEGGFLNFYKGFHFALMRAIPLHAGTFATMEYFKILEKNINKYY